MDLDELMVQGERSAAVQREIERLLATLPEHERGILLGRLKAGLKDQVPASPTTPASPPMAARLRAEPVDGTSEEAGRVERKLLQALAEHLQAPIEVLAKIVYGISDEVHRARIRTNLAQLGKKGLARTQSRGRWVLTDQGRAKHFRLAGSEQTDFYDSPPATQEVPIHRQIDGQRTPDPASRGGSMMP